MILTTIILAAALTDRQYKREVEAIVAEDVRQLAAMPYTPQMRAIADNLILLDSYLVLNELHKLPHHTTRERVDKYVAQLSRDMESLPY